MTPRVEAFLVVGLVTTLATLVATPLCRRLALRTGVIVAPDERRVHERPTPLLGGVAMAIGLLAGMVTASRLPALAPIFRNSTEPIGVVLAAMLMVGVGVLDDVRDVSPPAKTAGIVLCASVLVRAGISMVVFRIPLGGVIVLGTDWSYLLSVLWVYGMTTAVNWIDGLDGLAAGIVGIAAATYFVYTLGLGDSGVLLDTNIGPLLAIVMAGMCLGFLPMNFHPAKIFMGDGGALLLGLLMAASTLVVGGRTGAESSASGQAWFFFAPLFIPLVILGVPMFDSAWAILRRLVRRQGVATADREHLHHRLMRLGHGHRRSVLILWGWTILLCGLVLYRPGTGKGSTGGAAELSIFVTVGIAAIGLTLFTMLSPRLRTRRNGGGEPAAGPPHDAENPVAAGPRPGETSDDPLGEPTTTGSYGSSAGEPTEGAARPIAAAAPGTPPGPPARPDVPC